MKIYVSSTFVDLEQYRQAVTQSLRTLGHECVAMEEYSAEDQVPFEKCLRDVAECDLYVGIFAWRYGYVPPGQDRSVTELEYRVAERLGITKFVFLLHEDTPWPRKFCDQGEAGSRIVALREELSSTRLFKSFSDPNTLSTRVVTAVARHQRNPPASAALDRFHGVNVPVLTKPCPNAILTSWTADRSGVWIRVAQDHPRSKEVRLWLDGAFHRQGGDGRWWVIRAQYLDAVPALSRLFGKGCCPSLPWTEPGDHNE
jgi:hypothetical protein